MSLFDHILKTLCLCLLAPLASIEAQITDRSYTTSYDTVVQNVQIVDLGAVKCLQMSGTTTKTETCTETTYLPVCIEGMEVLVFLLPYGGITIAVVDSVSYRTIETGSTTTTSTSTCPFYNIAYVPSFSSSFFVNTFHSIVVSEDDGFRHEVRDAVSATFEGVPLTQGQEIDFSDYGPGTYNYTLVRSNGVETSTHVFTITAESSHRLEQVDQPFSRRTLPTSLFEFTNETDDSIDLFLEATSTSPSLDVYLPNNVAMVAPGETIQREVLYTTNPGHGIPKGANFSALVSASSLGDHLSTIEVVAASNAKTQGSGEDLRIQSELDNQGLPSMCTKTGDVGARYTVTVDSPRGTFDGAPVTLGLDTFTLERPIPRISETVPFHLSSNHQSLALGTLAPGGVTYSTPLSASLKGLVLRCQAIVPSALAANGEYALSDAFDVRVR